MNDEFVSTHVRVEALLNRALDVVDHLRTYPQQGTFTGYKRALDTALIKEAATELGLTSHVVASDYVLLESDGRAMAFRQHTSSHLLQLDRAATNEKGTTKRILQASGVPVSPGAIVSKESAAEAALRKIASPWVVKPSVGTGGHGVTVGLRTEQDALQVVKELFSSGARKVLIEEMIFGIDLRVAVLDGEMVGVTLRVPANVVGDGVSPIQDLVEQKNQARAQSDYLKYQKLSLNQATVRNLQGRGYDVAYVPARGERVFLHYVANISSGGDSYEIPDLLHPDLVDLATKTASLFPSARHAGIDILAEYIDRPLAEQRAVICEVNLNNELPLHAYPAFGAPSPIAMQTVRSHWEAESSSRQVPSSLVEDPVRVTSEEIAQIVAETRVSVPQGVLELDKYRDAVPQDVISVWRMERRLLRRAMNNALAGAGKVRGTINLSTGLVEFSEGTQVFCADLTRRNVHAGVNARNAVALYNNAKLAGVPTTGLFKIPKNDFAAAADVVESGGRWELQYWSGDRLQFAEITEVADLAEIWPRSGARRKTTLLNKTKTAECGLLMHGGELISVQMTIPPTIFGYDGNSVANLVKEEAQRRQLNPYLRLTSTRAFAQYETTFAAIEQPLADGQALQLSDGIAVQNGATTINLAKLPWPQLQEMAARLNALVGNPGLGYYGFSAVPAENSLEWRLHSYSAAAGLERHAFPRYGEPADVYGLIAERALAGPRRRLL